MILSEIREERLLPFLPAIKVPFGLVAYVPSNDEGDRDVYKRQAKYSDSEYLINKLNKITPYEIKFRR